MSDPLPRRAIVYIAGRWISSAGDWLCSVALGWVITTSSLFAFSRFLTAFAVVLVAPMAGGILRRGGTVRLGVSASLGACLNSLLIALAVLLLGASATGSNTTEELQPLLLAVLFLCFSSGIFGALREAAEARLQGDLVPPPSQHRFENLWTVSYYMGRVIFGLVSGLISKVFGIAVLFVADALSFAALALLIAVAGRRTLTEGAEPQLQSAPRSIAVLRELGHDLIAGIQGYWDAIRAVSRDQTLVMLLWLLFIVEGVGYTSWNYLPGIVKGELHGDVLDYGVAVALSGAGGLLGILSRMVVLRLQNRAGPVLFAIACIAAPAFLIAVSLSTTVVGVGIWYGASLFAWTWFSVPIRVFCKVVKERSFAVTVHTLVLIGICRISQVALVCSMSYGAGLPASTGLRTSAITALVLLAATVLVFPRRVRDTIRSLFDPAAVNRPD